MSNSNFLWEIILREIKNEVTPQVFETWFSRASIDNVDFVKKRVVITSKELLVSQYIQGTYDAKLKEILKINTGLDLHIDYDSLDNHIPIQDSTSSFDNKIPAENIIKQNFLQGDKPSGAQHFYQKQTFTFDDYKQPIPNKNITNSKKNPTLNKNYTFENFVVGEGNAFTHNIAWNVAVEPGGIYNPLFIYGGVGLGKTHLMHAIANRLKEKNSNYKIAYVTSEKFTNELINSIKEKNNEEFRKKYRSLDVLLIDDIQFIEGKEATQEEFFHTFNELHSNNKQIIISSDRPPQELVTLEDRLRSRFESGVPIDIQAPDFETRVAILKKKCEIDQRDISDDVLILIAKNIKSNIRELEGSLNKVWSYSKIMQTPITYDMATEVLKDMLKNKETKELNIDYIKQVVAKEFNIKIDDLSSKARPKNIAYPRQIAMYLSRELTDLSLPKIGEEFGGRDHTTVMHACDKIKDDIEKKTDKIDVKIDKIIAILKD